ncbi:MAG: aldehyde dehydrogenase family protein [Lautropia sp.]|nr:MAG: aldehyde dehydrogenase family protein [Pseudomonadota bacterium]MBC6958744.1 aldehyde dehydrogenase family protein [Lautropia sp.]MCL4702900.1 aldehyde dehydrogenase family protein [Burkholderiaceae bacterium]MDL1907756.1 aldehyde dehydrogenase family protein [Betaproteobacteria bacterium PRO1]RIK89425.1 MAG: aldehyde dehydrogenase family protein [Burkholderiales bacterium]
MKKHAHYVAGEWVDSGDWAPNVNPSDTRDVIGEYARADEALTRRAIEAARTAFAAWSLATPQARADALDHVGSEILARKEELGNLLAREEGKTLPEAIGEVARAGQIFKFFAGEALRVVGDKQMSVRPGMEIEVTREPVGVVGIIAPWNFPIAIPAWKIAPALAYGNCVVFKPADLVPGSAWALTEIISRSGLPAGVFNLVMGRGRVVGEVLLNHRDVNAITFTGSASTGARVAAACVARQAKFQLEMGGKNPLVILNDADLDAAVHCAIQGAFFSTGQRCTASSRLVVEAGIHDRFVEALTRRTGALEVGDARAAGVDIGPVVDQAQLDQDLGYIEIGRSEGATLACGGERISASTPGFYLAPTVFVDTHNGMRINREEIFGPVASVIRVADYEEALAVANDTEFGLTSGICTNSLRHASHFKRHAQAGMVMVNAPTAGVDFHVPFGGRKGSSFGPREQGSYAAEFYTTVKTAYIQT